MAILPLRAVDRHDTGELDQLTVVRAQRGDHSAQTALIERYQRPVFSLLSRMLRGERALTEDLAQETFLRVLRGLPAFDTGGPARLSTWVLTIATRLAVDHLRRRVPAFVEADGGALPSALPQPDQDADRRVLAASLARAVDDLGAPFRAAFLLREVHGLSYDQIAVTLAIDPGTVKSRLARARAALQAALAEIRDG
jgi:RNA polymerase sigma-70 factor (ECF subfamily)